MLLVCRVSCRAARQRREQTGPKEPFVIPFEFALLSGAKGKHLRFKAADEATAQCFSGTCCVRASCERVKLRYLLFCRIDYFNREITM